MPSFEEVCVRILSQPGNQGKPGKWLSLLPVREKSCNLRKVPQIRGKSGNFVCPVVRLSRLHSKNCGVKITPPVLTEDHTMHFTPVLNLWCWFNTQWWYSNTFGCYFNTLWCCVQTLGCNINTRGCGPLLTPTGVILTPQFYSVVSIPNSKSSG